jgi:hypothetical protein
MGLRKALLANGENGTLIWSLEAVTPKLGVMSDDTFKVTNQLSIIFINAEILR